jgi:hypothetical protein
MARRRDTAVGLLNKESRMAGDQVVLPSVICLVSRHYKLHAIALSDLNIAGTFLIVNISILIYLIHMHIYRCVIPETGLDSGGWPPGKADE